MSSIAALDFSVVITNERNVKKCNFVFKLAKRSIRAAYARLNVFAFLGFFNQFCSTISRISSEFSDPAIMDLERSL